jgi:hypothetical protein
MLASILVIEFIRCFAQNSIEPQRAAHPWVSVTITDLRSEKAHVSLRFRDLRVEDDFTFEGHAGFGTYRVEGDYFAEMQLSPDEYGDPTGSLQVSSADGVFFATSDLRCERFRQH